MTNKDWQKKALELREEGYSNRAIGRKLGKDESVVRRYFKRLGEQVEIFGESLDIPVESHWDKFNPHPAQLEMINKGYEFKIYGYAAAGGTTQQAIHAASTLSYPFTGDGVLFKRVPADNSRILIISDMHIPYHHPDTLAFLQHLKEKYEPTRVICLGDELDKHSLSFHDSDPNLPSAGDELKLALPVIQQLKEMFPVMDILESNHGSLLYRKAHASGIPKQYLKSYNEVLGVDSGWQWHYDMVVDLPNGQKCYFHHGKSANVTKTSQTMSMCSVQGHFHETFKIEYWANPIALYWAMQTGCLIDDKSYAFNYNNVNLKRPIIGTGLIIDSQPILEPMVLNTSGRWVLR